MENDANSTGLATEKADTTPDSEGSTETGGAASGERQLNEHGFPDGTPTRDMSVEEQMAYWKYQSRKHESAVKALKANADTTDVDALRTRVKELEDEKLTDQERDFKSAVDAARTEGFEKARAEMLPVIQESQLFGFASTVISGDRLDAWVRTTNAALFVGDDGHIEGQKVVDHLKSLFGDSKSADVPSTPSVKYPNFGQGAPTGGGARPSHRDVGLAQIEKRFGKKPAA